MLKPHKNSTVISPYYNSMHFMSKALHLVTVFGSALKANALAKFSF